MYITLIIAVKYSTDWLLLLEFVQYSFAFYSRLNNPSWALAFVFTLKNICRFVLSSHPTGFWLMVL